MRHVYLIRFEYADSIELLRETKIYSIFLSLFIITIIIIFFYHNNNFSLCLEYVLILSRFKLQYLVIFILLPIVKFYAHFKLKERIYHLFK